MGIEDLVYLGATAAGFSAAAGLLAWVFYSRFFIRVPPNRALVIYGGPKRPETGSAPHVPPLAEIRRPRIVVGGRAFVAPWNRSVAYLSLSPVDIDLTVRSLHSREGGGSSGWAVDLALQAKVPADPGLLAAAAENLLGKDEESVRTVLRQAAEGAIPAILARQDPDGAEPDWERLASEIQAAVAADLVTLGLAVHNLAIKQLTRISNGSGSGVSVSSRSPDEPPGRSGGNDSDPYLPGFDLRVSRLERSIGVLGAQVDRIAQEGNPDDGDPVRRASVAAPLGFGRRGSPSATATRRDPVHDSMGSDRRSRSRLSSREGSDGGGSGDGTSLLDVETEG